MSFHHYMCRHFRRCLTSLQSVLPRASYQMFIKAPVFNDKCKFSTEVQRIVKHGVLLTNSRHLSIPLDHTRTYCSFINRTEFSVKLCCAHKNKTEIAIRINGVIIRSYQTLSKFTIESPMYASYLASLVEEYELYTRSEPSSVSADFLHQKLLRVNFLRPVVEVIKSIHRKHSEVQELTVALEAESDKDMMKLMQKEIENCREILGELEEQLADALVGEEPADHNDIVLEVTAGVGGQEAMLFAAEILNMYYGYAQYKGWTISGLNSEESDLGGIRRAVVEICGQDVYKHLKNEAGVHRVQRVPKTEKAGRIHTSTVSVSVLPQPGEIDIDIQQKDLKVETFRSSGPGGQSVNTTDSAVRITHLPTGTVSECRQERSQIKNRELAMKNLRTKLYQTILEEQVLKYRTARKTQMGTRGRSEKIRTYNFQQDRITDHRLKENCSNLATFMTGGEELDDLIGLLHGLDKVHILESMLEEYEAERTRTKSGKS